MARQCTKPKWPRNSIWFKKKVMLVVTLESGVVLDEEHMALLVDNGDTVITSQASHKIPTPLVFQTNDLDAFDSDCDEAPSPSAVLMAKHSAYDLEIISKNHSELATTTTLEQKAKHRPSLLRSIGGKKQYGGSKPLCAKCNYHHDGPCAPKCHNCNKIGHSASDCRNVANTNNANNQRGTELGQKPTCYECGFRGHYRRECPKLKNNNNHGNQGRRYNAPARTERQMLAGRLNMLFMDKRAHAYTRQLMEAEARMSREAWVRAIDASDLVYGEVISLRTTMLGQISEIRELQAADRRRQTVISELLRIDHRRSTETSDLRTALQGQVTALQGQVTALQAQVTTLQGQQGLAGDPTHPELPEEASGSA
nr:hypothetical protein [Tanacetum cinerariifolium]